MFSWCRADFNGAGGKTVALAKPFLSPITGSKNPNRLFRLAPAPIPFPLLVVLGVIVIRHFLDYSVLADGAPIPGEASRTSAAVIKKTLEPFAIIVPPRWAGGPICPISAKAPSPAP
jgi:hypothetical protein